ncbi:MAG TPA: sulfotransferase family 2 domain-containing protein [Bauldia sp.]|nr:sulfotransferase family 2 domain-containing protein [Bauldia sp.]
MISHEYRCIFIHIPRCAGSSIEAWIGGEDQWFIEPAEKHLVASLARLIYAPYWKSYFKFAFVRDPFARTVSLLHYKDFFGVEVLPDGSVDLSGYLAHFGSPVTVEHDYRFFSRGSILSPRHKPNAVYANILDEELDFIGRFENLYEDTERIRAAIGIRNRFVPHLQRSTSPPPPLSEAGMRQIEALYAEDFRRFGYAPVFGSSPAFQAERMAS